MKTIAIAWVHPRKGDDYQIELEWNGTVSDKDITAEIRNQGCQFGTDFRRV
jgi:hypothetical protein